MDEMSKQGLYIWLKSLVESGKCPGVSWVDQDEGMFRIPWSNQKSRSWQKEDSSIFLEYAKHTGKYKPDDKMDFPKWKQNLKSAINKSRFIDRMRNFDCLSGPKPYRVYKFLSDSVGRKRSDDSIVDVLKRHVVGEDYHKADEGMWNTLNSMRSTSTSSSMTSGTESESDFQIPLRSHLSLSISPDIPRSDTFDQPHGNIPVFVDALSDEVMSGENEDYTLRAGMIETHEPDYLLGTNVSSDQKVIMGTQVLGSADEALSTLLQRVEGNDQNQRPSLLFVALQPQPQILPQSTTADTKQTMLYNNPAADSKQTLVYSTPAMDIKLTESGYYSVGLSSQDAYSLTSDTATGQGLNYSAPAPDSSDLATRVILLQDAAHNHDVVYPNPVQENEVCPQLVQPTTSFHVPHIFTTVGETQLQQAGPGIELSRDIKIPHDTQSSFCEIRMDNGLPPDLHSSMDTSEDNFSSSNKQKYSTTQFINYRDTQLPTGTQNEELTPKKMSDNSVVHIQVLYGTPHRIVKEVRLLPNRSSCRLFFGSVNTQILQDEIRGLQNAEEVELPPVDPLDYKPDTKTTIRNILKDMELGILITYRDGDIFVERRCLPRVYLSDGVSSSESLPRSTKKRPDVETKAFDFNKKFRESIELNKRQEGPVPKDHFFLTVGYQIIPNDDSPTRLVPVYIVVRHVLAAFERYKILGASANSPNPMCSDPNSFDKVVQLYKELDLKKS